jgi:glycosyltransferase involved in cell wall biosynthesis
MSYLLQDEKLKVIKEFKISTPPNRQQLSCPEREKNFSRILIDYEISSVHFQHLLNHTPSLPIITKSLGIGVLYSLHDFYSICDNLNLVGATKKYCGLETQTESGCDSCLLQMHNALPGSQAIRRNFFNKVLDSCDAIQVNSLDTKSKHELIFGRTISKGNKTTQIGVPIEKLSKASHTFKFKFQKSIKHEHLNVAIVGNFTVEKGGHFFLQVFKQLSNWPVHFYIFGRIDEPFIEPLQDSTLSNVTVHGPYKLIELDSLLKGMDASIHNSIWPETYCLTLSEAWNAGIFPIVSDIGALGERVIDSVNGLKFPVENVGKIVDILRSLSANPSMVRDFAKNNSANNISYGPEHRKWLTKKYFEISNIYDKTQTNRIQKKIDSSLSLKDCVFFLNNPIWLQK